MWTDNGLSADERLMKIYGGNERFIAFSFSKYIIWSSHKEIEKQYIKEIINNKIIIGFFLFEFCVRLYKMKILNKYKNSILKIFWYCDKNDINGEIGLYVNRMIMENKIKNMDLLLVELDDIQLRIIKKSINIDVEILNEIWKTVYSSGEWTKRICTYFKNWITLENFMLTAKSLE